MGRFCFNKILLQAVGFVAISLDLVSGTSRI